MITLNDYLLVSGLLFSIGFAGVLLRRVKAPIVFYGCYSAPGSDPFRDWRFELRLPAVIQPEELAGLDASEVAGRINLELEKLILHRPEEMFWLHDRFRGAPADFSDESAKSEKRQKPPGGKLSSEATPSS